MDIQKLKSLKFYNLIAPEENIKIDLSKQITVITGFNGSGKSACLSAIHQIVSMYSSNGRPFPRKDWAGSITVDNNFYNFYNFSCNSPDKTTYDEVSRILSSPLELEDAFHKAKDLLRPSFENKHVIKSREGFSLNYLSTSAEDIDIEEKGYFFKSILFMNENLSSSSKNEFEVDNDSLDSFSKKINIDKSLYSLLLDFSVQARVEKRLNEVYSEFVKKMFNVDKDFSSIKEALEENSDIENELLTLDRIKRDLNKSKNDLKEKPINTFMSILNSFFKETKREFFINDDGFLNLRCNYKNGKQIVVEWYSLSMGEKNLLTLLLLAFLNRKNEILFLLDEPDLSMHISWQKKFIKTISKLSPKSKFIVSTHSPAMIDNSLDIQFINLNSI